MDFGLSEFSSVFLNLEKLHWVRADLLFLLLAIPVLFFICTKLIKSNLWSSFIKEPMLSFLLKGRLSNRFSPYFICLFFALGIVALSGPSKDKQFNDTSKNIVPLFIVLDLSLSMLSTDESPSRLDLAKYRITDILRKQKDGLASLIVYSGSAHTVTPLTADVRTILNQLPPLNPQIMPQFGSNPQEAFRLLQKSLIDLGKPQGRVLWITDEATNKEMDSVFALTQSLNQELILLAIGSKSGSTIPLDTGLLYDTNGQPAISRTPISSMRLNALKNGILFYEIKNLNASLSDMLANKEVVTPIITKNDEQQSEIWHELGYWLAIPLLLILIPMMRSNLIVLFLSFAIKSMVLTASLYGGFVQADWKNWFKNSNQQGANLYEQQEFDEAAKTFSNSAWQSTSHYRAKSYEQATELYKRNNDFYNLGNALAQLGKFDEAIDAYEEVLKSQPKHKDAQFNLNLLQSLTKQQNNQQSEQNNSEQQQNQEGDEQQQSSSKNEQSDQSQSNNQNLEKDKSHLQNKQQEKQQESEQSMTSDEQNEDEENDNKEQQATSAEENDEEQQKKEQQAQIKKQLNLEEIAEREKNIEYKQWLRRIPENPELLLKRKFNYQLQQRKKTPQQKNKQIW